MTKEELDEKVFIFIYKMAFNDATMRNAFPKTEDEEKEGKDGDDKYKQRKENARKEAFSIVKKYAEELIAGKEINVKDFILEVCDKTEEYGFTVGNAQKLINMTGKYLYIATYSDTEKKEIFEKCHCPIDEKIAKDAIKNMSREEKKKYKDYAWSKEMDINRYLRLQEIIKELCAGEYYPLEYDYVNWLKEEEKGI